MKLKNTIITLLLCWISQEAGADRNNAFPVNASGRFRPEAVPYLNRGSELLEKGDLKGAKQNFRCGHSRRSEDVGGIPRSRPSLC